MHAELCLAALALLMVVVLMIRSALRKRCLGRCAGCPHAPACPKSSKNALGQEPEDVCCPAADKSHLEERG